mgnify:CR=1 FL=1
MTSRIGVFGGMFDPVHNGHIEAANLAVSALELDQLRLVPCALPNHRDPARATAQQRVRMLELAISGWPKLSVDQREIEREGVSYAVDTLQSLRDEFPEHHLVFIMGLDSFNTLPQWHQWLRLFELAHLMVLNREGGELSEEVCEALKPYGRLVAKSSALFEQSVGNVYFEEAFANDFSSSRLRERMRANEEVDSMINERVHLFIEDERLYR